MLTLGNQYIHPLTFKRPVGAMRHPQITTTTCLIHYVSIPLLGLKAQGTIAPQPFDADLKDFTKKVLHQARKTCNNG